MHKKQPRTRRDKRTPSGHVDNLPSRADITRVLADMAEPSSLRQIAAALEVNKPARLEALGRRVLAMARDGQLVENRRGRFGLASEMELLAGRVLAHRDGFAFVRPDAGGDDVFIAPREARQVLHGDKVLIRIAGLDRRGRANGRVVEVLERANESVVGRFAQADGIGYVIPDNHRINQDILIPAGQAGDARHGQIVLATIRHQPDKHTQPVGEITEILGEHMAPGMEIEIAIRAHQIPSEWPESLAPELAALPDKIDLAQYPERTDLTALPLVTIDGADARDFDDAVHVRRTAKGFRLTVAIADVSHYVTVQTELDTEARHRATSVYFPDRVIPMLPEQLSNGLCSLVPNENRLALVCEMNISDSGEVRRSRFYDAVICSHARLIYTDVQAWHDGKKSALSDISAEVSGSLEALYDLYAVFREARERRGALDVETVEPRFSYDQAGKIAGVDAVRRVDAHRLIEECMIAANVAAARYLEKHHAPALFRIHESPDEERLEALATTLAAVGITLGQGKHAEAGDLSRILELARKRPDRQVLETLVLRSLKLAVYSESNLGHFGLGLPAYAHFTSPIRRYPDLAVHRAIKGVLENEPPAELAQMAELAVHCSMAERRADDATRDAIAWLKCEFMLNKIGEDFAGVVTSVVEFGIFIELEDIFVEGLVHVSELPGDYYHFDATHHVLRGRARGGKYALGQKVKIKVARVDLDERKIDFVLAEQSPKKRSRGKKR